MMTINSSNETKIRGRMKGRAKPSSLAERENIANGQKAKRQVNGISNALTMSFYQMFSIGAGTCR